MVAGQLWPYTEDRRSCLPLSLGSCLPRSGSMRIYSTLCKLYDKWQDKSESKRRGELCWKCRLCRVGKLVSKICWPDMSPTCRHMLAQHVGNMWSVVTIFWMALLATCRHVGVMLSTSVCHTLLLPQDDRIKRNKYTTIK